MERRNETKSKSLLEEAAKCFEEFDKKSKVQIVRRDGVTIVNFVSGASYVDRNGTTRKLRVGISYHPGEGGVEVNFIDVPKGFSGSGYLNRLLDTIESFTRRVDRDIVEFYWDDPDGNLRDRGYQPYISDTRDIIGYAKRI
ncbi:hypothetical protein D6829_02240 [Candidatus Pacearchaeota archaeon]|nr:MAG: hypothetical protein D6829_02240 [Candidatus Pacearchaeota archaeon]